MAMKAKMAADKEKLKAEKRHQEVCIDNLGFYNKPGLLTRSVKVDKSEKADGVQGESMQTHVCQSHANARESFRVRSGEQGLRSGESTRLSPSWPGLSLLLVLVPAPRVFLREFRFSSVHKTQPFQIPIRSGNSGRRATLWLCHRNSHLID